eukprot:COSAG02_NODE_3617_length_6471_cov_4.987759_3_plen_84_part_00
MTRNRQKFSPAASLESRLANFGELTAYPSPVNVSAVTKIYDASCVPFDNVRGTNAVPCLLYRSTLLQLNGCLWLLLAWACRQG